MPDGSLRAGLVVLALVAAGCIGPKDGEVDSSKVENVTTSNATCFDGCNIAAFNETNLTETGKDGVDHHHDMWEGRSRVTIFETQAMMEPFPGDTAVAEFQPPQNTFIYEGTASVEFTISDPARHACEPFINFDGHFICTDYTQTGIDAPPVPDPTGGPAGLKLQYKHASTNQWIDVGELKWGTAIPIKITDPKQTDMPHATSSVWRFRVVSPNPYDSTLSFKAKADIVRAEGEIPLWPPHPKFYTDEMTGRVVVDNVQAEACEGTSCALGDPDKQGRVSPTKLISYGTRTLFVWVNVTSFAAGNPAQAPNSWFIYHVNASGYDNITGPDPEKYPIDKKDLFWILPVDDGGMDSPYADGSRWQFQLGTGATLPTDLSCYSGCSDWSAKYTITVIASSIELPPDQYDRNCLDANVYCPTGQE